VFDPDRLTLASRELACGTRVRITGPSGASVEAIATDWGPAEWTNRRFDLSRATFAAIHPIGAGVTHVRVEVLEEF
jgi:rare lipoprotein A (peptidoglycan hydrolase)